MANFKIKWCFINSKQATKAIDLLGAKSLDKINFYASDFHRGQWHEKKIDSINYYSFSADEANKRAKKDLRTFFKKQSSDAFVEFVRN
jgi:hypothetical protein